MSKKKKNYAVLHLQKTSSELATYQNLSVAIYKVHQGSHHLFPVLCLLKVGVTSSISFLEKKENIRRLVPLSMYRFFHSCLSNLITSPGLNLERTNIPLWLQIQPKTSVFRFHSSMCGPSSE